MLAQSGKVTDALDEWGEAAVEWKYDGARVQVRHDSASDESTGPDGDSPETHLFSRNMEEVTDPFPEVVEFVKSNLDEPAILDGEVVAVADVLLGVRPPVPALSRRVR